MRIGEVARGPDGVDRRIYVTPEDKLITIWGLYDAHVDNAAVHLPLLKRTIKAIADDPTARVIVGGDFNDLMFGFGDPRFNLNVLSKDMLKILLKANDEQRPIYLADALVDYNVELLDPIKDKIDAYISGNHEEVYARRHTTNIAMRTADKLGAAFYPDDCWVRYFVDHGSCVRTSAGHVYHGAGGNAPVTKGVVDLNRTLAGWQCDWTMRGHNHQHEGGNDVALRDKGAFGNCKSFAVPRASQICGTFERGFVAGLTNFSRSKHMKPSPLGSACIYLNLEYTNGLEVIPSTQPGVPRG